MDRRAAYKRPAVPLGRFPGPPVGRCACRMAAPRGRSATEPNDLDGESDQGSCAAYEWFGFRGSYKCDTVFHIPFGRDQLAECSFSGSCVGSLAKCLLQFTGRGGMVLALAGGTRECGYDGVLSIDARMDSVAGRGCVPFGG